MTLFANTPDSPAASTRRPLASQRRRLSIWLGTIAAATALVVVVGGITRLTHSGLSIVDWRPVVGIVPPLNESEWAESFARYRQFPEYRQLRPHMTMAEYQRIYYWEYLHRLAARMIGLVFLIPFAFFYVSGALTRPITRRVLVLFVLGGVQGVAGWLMVRSGLIDRPSVSHYRLALHLALALAIFGFCVWLIRDLSVDTTRIAAPAAAAGRRTRQILTVVGGLLGAQIVWGAFVAGLKAGFVFNTFPLMGGTLLPAASWTGPAALAFIQDPSGVQWMHRVLGTVLLAAALALRVHARRRKIGRAGERFCGALFWMIAAQYLLGVLTLIYVVPIGLAVAHQAMAVAIVGLWVCAMHHVRGRPHQ